MDRDTQRQRQISDATNHPTHAWLLIPWAPKGNSWKAWPHLNLDSFILLFSFPMAVPETSLKLLAASLEFFS